MVLNILLTLVSTSCFFSDMPSAVSIGMTLCASARPLGVASGTQWPTGIGPSQCFGHEACLPQRSASRILQVLQILP